MITLKRIVLGAIAVLLSTTVAAESVIEEIIVTAQKREQSLQDVPLSVTAVSGERLTSLQRNSIADLTKMMPGLTYKDGATDNGRSLQIRGIGTTSFSRGVEQSVGMQIDGVVTSALATSFLDMNDVQRVEVLRGPQGMLFGKNSSAGLINIVTNNPTDEFEWGLSAGFAEENERKYTAYFSGPISDTIKARLAMSSTTRDPFIENTNPNASDYNDRDEQALNLKIQFQPSDNLDLMFSYKLLERGNLNGGAGIPQFYPAPFDTIYPAIAAAAGGTLPASEEGDEFFSFNNSQAETDQDLFSLEVNYDFGDHRLVSITSYTESDILGNARGFGWPVNVLPMNLSRGMREQWTQELRIESPADQDFSYVVGFYYYKNELDRKFDRTINLNALAGLPFVFNLDITGQYESESWAVFGQGTWNISDRFRISLGARYTDEEVDVFQVQTFNNPDPFVGMFALPEAAPGTANDSQSDTNVSWRLIAEYDWKDNALLFANVARGYKGAAANMLSSATTTPNVIIDPEIPTNFEVGIKSDWLDGRLQLNATAYRSEFEDFQASISVLVNTAPVFILDNAGELESQGLEIELTAIPTDNLLVQLSIAAVDATFEDYTGAECYGAQTEATGCFVVGGQRQQDLSGKDLPYSPDLSYTLFARYDIELESMPFNAYIQGMYHWRDESIYSTANDPDTLHDDYGLLDLGLGIESDDGRYEVQLWVKNATDEFYMSDLSAANPGFAAGRTHYLEYTYTRRVGVTLSMDF